MRTRLSTRHLALMDSVSSAVVNNHQSQECRVERTALYCRSCSKHRHVAKVCITTLMQKKNSHLGKEIKQITECYDTSKPYLVYGINLLADFIHLK